VAGTWPCSGLPVEPTAKRILTTEELRRRFASAGKYHALFAVAAFAGLRLSEVLALTWEDVDLDRCTVHVHKQLSRPTRSIARRPNGWTSSQILMRDASASCSSPTTSPAYSASTAGSGFRVATSTSSSRRARVLEETHLAHGLRVERRAKPLNLLSHQADPGREYVRLRPDLLIGTGTADVLVADAKWKVLNSRACTASRAPMLTRSRHASPGTQRGVSYGVFLGPLGQGM
jgi:integrase